MAYVLGKAMQVNGEWRQAGEPVPEAASWRNLRSYLELGHVREVAEAPARAKEPAVDTAEKPVRSKSGRRKRRVVSKTVARRRAPVSSAEAAEERAAVTAAMTQNEGARDGEKADQGVDVEAQQQPTPQPQELDLGNAGAAGSDAGDVG
jgi:hypothetical protein